MLAQKFLGDAFHKMKESLDNTKQTQKAFRSVNGIKHYQLKTQGKLTKQKIEVKQQLIKDLEAKMASQELMLQILEEERFNTKKRPNLN